MSSQDRGKGLSSPVLYLKTLTANNEVNVLDLVVCIFSIVAETSLNVSGHGLWKSAETVASKAYTLRVV